MARLPSHAENLRAKTSSEDRAGVKYVHLLCVRGTTGDTRRWPRAPEVVGVQAGHRNARRMLEFRTSMLVTTGFRVSYASIGPPRRWRGFPAWSLRAERRTWLPFDIDTPRAYLEAVFAFIESSVFDRLRAVYLDDDEFSELQFFMMQNPDAGAVVPGSGGVRKLRWCRETRRVARHLFRPISA